MPITRTALHTIALLALPVVTACGGSGAGRHAVVASVAGAPLDTVTIARWLVASRQIPSAAVANYLVSSWIDRALFAKALGDGAVLTDSSTVDAVIWPDAARGTLRLFWEARREKMAPPTDPQIDSLTTIDRVRVFQQLVIRTPSTNDTAALRKVRERVSQVVRRADLEPDFTALVRQLSDDSISRVRGGFMPALTRRELPAAIGDAIWALGAGAHTPALRAADGYHIFRRASRAEGRPFLKDWLVVALAQNAEGRFQDSLIATKNVAMASGVEGRIRAIAREPVLAADSAPLVTWTGGALRPAQARLWLIMLLPDNRFDVSTASDVSVQAFLQELVRREVLLQVAAPGGPLTPAARQELGAQYRRVLDSLRGEVRRVGGAGSPAAVATASIDSAGAGHVLLHPLPGALAGVLRARYPVTVDQAALDAIAQSARKQWIELHRGDSLTSNLPAVRP